MTPQNHPLLCLEDADELFRTPPRNYRLRVLALQCNRRYTPTEFDMEEIRTIALGIDGIENVTMPVPGIVYFTFVQPRISDDQMDHLMGSLFCVATDDAELSDFDAALEGELGSAEELSYVEA